MSLYQPVKYALMIILLLGLIVCILQLAPEVQKQRTNTNQVIVQVISLITILIGLMGAYRNNRQLLLTFAIILSIMVIVAVVQSQQIAIVGNAILDIVAIVLAVYQSEMIRSGDM